MTTSKDLTNLQKNVRQFTETECEAMGRRIREAREKKGIKQIELALQLAIGKNQMYRIENGQTPCKTEYLYEIAQVLDVSLEYLFFGDQENREVSENGLTKKENLVQEMISLCRGKDLEEVHKALHILKAFFD